MLQVDFSRRGLCPADAHGIAKTIQSNLQLTVLKLGYNNLGDEGTATIAASVCQNGRFHSNLTVLDLGFNGIGDLGCSEIAVKALAGNHVMRTLFLTGNCIRQKGAMALAGAILHGCSLSRLHMSANDLGPTGIKALTGAIAEAESRRQQILQRTGGIVIPTVKPVEFEDLRLDGAKMGSRGFSSIPSMILTNSTIRVLSLSNNGLDDKHMALLSQALAQNQSFPIASLQLSFNKITCVGVECLMNAIWGSKTLCEVKLDNNLIADRGAQLCSVVLGSVALQSIDLGYNGFTTVGIKAIMKSLSENDSVRSLAMTGIPMDQNASKAVSYALAYNCSLEAFNIDSCGIGYSGQRHIVAGIVSNRNGKLRSVTGFPLGRKYLFCIE
jgi:Ran GTPase-activating protein (RanGAP) involved in mRNA processing and transport